MCKVARVLEKAFVLSLFALGWSAVLLLTTSAENLDGTDQTQRQVVMENLNRMPLLFTENRGQLHEDVSFYVQGSNKRLYFTPQGVTFALTGTIGDNEATRRWVVKFDFVGVNPAVRPKGKDRQEAIISYFRGRLEDWKTGLPTYGKVVYPDLWPSINLVYSGSVNKLKYEFVVKPGADPNPFGLSGGNRRLCERNRPQGAEFACGRKNQCEAFIRIIRCKLFPAPLSKSPSSQKVEDPASAGLGLFLNLVDWTANLPVSYRAPLFVGQFIAKSTRFAGSYSRSIYEKGDFLFFAGDNVA